MGRAAPRIRRWRQVSILGGRSTSCKASEVIVARNTGLYLAKSIISIVHE